MVYGGRQWDLVGCGGMWWDVVGCGGLWWVMVVDSDKSVGMAVLC